MSGKLAGWTRLAPGTARYGCLTWPAHDGARLSLAQQGTLRFGQLAESCGGISQKMLTQTLRRMERDGLVTRTVYPVVPPKVQYRCTDLGLTLGEAFCGVWEWAAANRTRVEEARAAFDARTGHVPS